MRKATVLVIFLILCVGLTGCYSNKKSAPIVQNHDEAPTEEDEIYKYNAYVDLNNYIVKDFAETLDDYFKHLGNEQDPKFEKYFSFVPRSISKYDIEKLEKAFNASHHQPQYASVDGAAQELYPQMTDLINLLAEAHTYYKLKSYVDDNYVKAKELHTKIVNCYKIYQPLANKYCANFNAIASEREKRRLENYKNRGQLLKYHCLSVLMHAEALQQEMDEQQITADNILDLDLPKFQGRYNLLIADVNEIMKYSKDEQALKKEGITNSGRYESYINDIIEVKVCATQLMERVKQRRNFEKHQLGSRFFRESVDGSPEKFNKKLSDAIREYNHLN